MIRKLAGILPIVGEICSQEEPPLAMNGTPDIEPLRSIRCSVAAEPAGAVNDKLAGANW